MLLTISYKNGFIKTVIVDFVEIANGRLIYRTDKSQFDVDLNYLEDFYLRKVEGYHG